MGIKLSEIATKIGLSSNSFKTLAITSIEGGEAFDLNDLRRLKLGHYPYWNVWSNKSAAEWKLISNQYLCTLKPAVAFSDFGGAYNHNAQPPSLELPDRMYYLNSASFSGTFYAGDYDFLHGMDHFRVFLQSKNTSHYGISNPQPLQNMQGYQVSVSSPTTGLYYFGFVVQSGEDSSAPNYEVEQLRSDVELRGLPKQGSITTVNEPLYNNYFTQLTGCSGSIIVQNSQSDITINYRISYAVVSGDIVTPVSGLNGTLYSASIPASDKNRYRDIEIVLPTPIWIENIPSNYFIIIEIVSATGAGASWIEIPSEIYREN